MTIDIGDIEITEIDDEQEIVNEDPSTAMSTTESEPAVEKANGDATPASAGNLAPCERYMATKRDAGVKLRISGDENLPIGMKPLTVPQHFKKQVERFKERPAMKVERDGKWITWTYVEYLDTIDTVAKAFIHLGLEPFDGVGIIGFNSPEWLFADIAAIFAGALAVGVYTTNNSEMCRYVLEDARCSIAIVENDLQLQKILEVWDQLPYLKAIVQYTGEIKEKKPNLYTWNELVEMGRKVTDDKIYQQRQNDLYPNKCCSLIYTSGTTGNPKGVMLSHDNLIVCSLAGCRHVGLLPLQPKAMHNFISYLPLSHIAAQMTDIWLPVALGACVNFARPDALKGTLVESMKVIRPTVFVGVPRVFEKIEEKLKGIGATITGFKKHMSTWAKGKLLQGHQNTEKSKSVPYGWTIASKLMERVHRGLGLDRCQLLFTAAAPISRQTLEYFQSINLPLNELYGLSESTGPLTLNQRWACRTTSVGRLMEINESKVANPDEDGSGELCYRGRNIMMGYLNNEEKTAEVFDEGGFFKTGDVGKVDEDGFFYITGRIKELIITAGGENIAPVPIEDLIKEEIPLISTAMVIGDKKKFLSCLLTPFVEVDTDTGLSTDKLLPVAVNYCKSLGLEVSKSQDISPDVPEVLKKAIQEGIDRVNKKAVSNASRVQKWKLLPLEFTTSGGELGPTQKLRRPHVMKMYKETVDEFYT